MNDRLTWIGRTDSGVVRQRLYDRDIRTLLLSPLDPGRKAWDAAIRKEGGQTGRFIDPHWFNLASDGNALAFRRKCDEACAELLPGEMLMLDLELVSADYVKRLIVGAPGNRGLIGSSNKEYTHGTQFNQHITYTNMPYQDGSVVPIPFLVNYALDWYPQLYFGDMKPADSAAVVLEIARWDYPAQDIRPFYDGKLIASDQRDGGWFTAERIPGVFGNVKYTGSFAANKALIDHDETLRTIRTKDSLRQHYTQLAAAA